MQVAKSVEHNNQWGVALRSPTAEFLALAKDALEHLYDCAYLSTHALVGVLVPDTITSGTNPGRALRQILLDSVAQLKPESSLPAGAHQSRAYRILQLRYVEALSYQQVMSALALGQAQYHRDQRQALEALSALLWAKAESMPSRRPAVESARPRPPALYTELRSVFATDRTIADLNAVADSLAEILAELARDRQVSLRWDTRARPAELVGGRTAIRQLLISLVGYVLAGARGGALELSTHRTDGSIVFRADYRGPLIPHDPQRQDTIERLAVAQQLLESLGGGLSLEPTSDGMSAVATFPALRRSLLVIDDHPDFVQLMTRLVADLEYTVVSAASVAEGVTAARDVKPDVIILDIMMPNQDGWDALQLLKHDPLTQDIPVLVCSVLGEARLALALGAFGFIRKPPSLSALVEVLDRLARPSEALVGANQEQPELTELYDRPGVPPR